MELGYIILNAENILKSSISGVLGLTAINNIVHGNYQAAAIEGALSFWAGSSAYFGNQRLKQQKRIDKNIKEIKEQTQDLTRRQIVRGIRLEEVINSNINYSGK